MAASLLTCGRFSKPSMLGLRVAPATTPLLWKLTSHNCDRRALSCQTMTMAMDSGKLETPASEPASEATP